MPGIAQCIEAIQLHNVTETKTRTYAETWNSLLTVTHALCWCSKLMKAEFTITWPGHLLHDATRLSVKALGMALW